MGRSRLRRPKLPPLNDVLTHQVDWYCPNFSMFCADAYYDEDAAKSAVSSHDQRVPILIRRLRDGKIVYRNKAAREAGL